VAHRNTARQTIRKNRAIRFIFEPSGIIQFYGKEIRRLVDKNSLFEE
jgi:hypothetical protein